MPTFVVIVLVLAAIVLPCVAVAGAGFWFKRRLGRVSPNSQFLQKVNSSQALASAVLVLVLIAGAALHEFAPGTALGSFLWSPLGILSLFVGAWLLAVVIYTFTTYLHRHRSDGGGGRV